VILPYFPYNPKAKLRLEILFKKFHPRINLTTLFWTKLYLLNTIKLFSGHENCSFTKSQKTYSRGVPLGTWISKFWVFSFVFGPQDTRQKCRQIVLWWNLLNIFFISPFWVRICMGGTLRTQSFGVLSTKLSLKCKSAEQKWHPFCSMMKFVEQNWTK
jgi:hypothetical protein